MDKDELVDAIVASNPQRLNATAVILKFAVLIAVGSPTLPCMAQPYAMCPGGECGVASCGSSVCSTCPIGVDCADQTPCGAEARWNASRPLPWQVFAQGEYVGPARPQHVAEYRVRVDDSLVFVYRLTREVTGAPYELNVGDQIRVESLQDDNLDRELVIQPDGTITLRLLGQIQAAGLTIDKLRSNLEQLYTEYYKEPAITVTPVRVNTKLEDLRATVDNRAGIGGQSVTVVVSPDGSIQLPAVGPIPVQGLTLSELKMEVDARYRMVVQGIEVTPVLQQRAPRFVYVLGHVEQPGRFDLTGPTTAMQAIALAGGATNGGNLREIIVFRRAADWRLVATRLDLRGALYGKRPIPSDEIWLRDSDIVVIPKTPFRRTTDVIEEVFGRGVNELVPILTGLEVLELSGI